MVAETFQIVWFYGVMVSTQDSESCDPSSSLGRTLIYVKFESTVDEVLRTPVRSFLVFTN